eukprot:6390093-Pyramimonas_sp.AAC.1
MDVGVELTVRIGHVLKRPGVLSERRKALQGAEDGERLPGGPHPSAVGQERINVWLVEECPVIHVVAHLVNDKLAKCHKVLDGPFFRPAPVGCHPRGRGVVEERHHDLQPSALDQLHNFGVSVEGCGIHLSGRGDNALP